MTACGSSCHSLLPGQTWYIQTFRFVISRASPASNSCPSTSRRDEISKLSNIVFFFLCMFYKKYRKLLLKWSLLRYIIWAEKFMLESVWKNEVNDPQKDPFVHRIRSLWRIIQWVLPSRRAVAVITLITLRNTLARINELALDWSTICYLYTAK